MPFPAWGGGPQRSWRRGHQQGPVSLTAGGQLRSQTSSLSPRPPTSPLHMGPLQPPVEEGLQTSVKAREILERRLVLLEAMLGVENDV